TYEMRSDSSGTRTMLATPCPAPLDRSRLPSESRRLSTASWVDSQQDDTLTADIEYTRAIESRFGTAHPRRPRRPARSAGVIVFEDVVEGEELVVAQVKPLVGKTLLGKPARRGKTAAKDDWQSEAVRSSPLRELRQAPVERTVAPRAQQTRGSPGGQKASRKTGLRKDARRRTIFVPSEDTTMLTIHPGANTTSRLDDTFQLPGYSAQSPSVELRQPMDFGPDVVESSRRPRMPLAAPPKRLPLQGLPTTTSNIPGVDMAGQNGGKENIPPSVEESGSSPERPPKKVVVRRLAQKSPMGGRTRLYEPTAASQAKHAVVVRKAVPLAATRTKVWQPGAKAKDQPAASKAMQSATVAGAGVHHSPSGPTLDHRGSADSRGPTADQPSSVRATLPRRSPSQNSARRRLHLYPILSEDLAQPQLYEEGWLSHQEIALTELVNELIESTTPSKYERQSPPSLLRERTLQVYHQASVTTLYTRLKASLLFGALSRPKDMPSPPDPTRDIGLRKHLLNLWLHTYDEDALHAAAEVVVGRQIGDTKRLSIDSGLAASEAVLDPAKSRRKLVGFLETFFVTVEDSDDQEREVDEPRGKEMRRWRRTVLRSLMLIWLLDHAKTTGVVSGCLFKRTSSHKTSTSVVRALSSMLIPSLGDILRPLRQFDYAVVHGQDPLEEVHYYVKNIATDLRDGVFLTRLVEILLYSSQRRANEAPCEGTGEPSMTLQLPDATILESALYGRNGLPRPRLLSQHLKMPCLGRAQKVYNVQVALCALIEHGGHAATFVNNITADDVVDGHREKTLSLLWALLSTHGLARMVNWGELAKDTGCAGDDASCRPARPHEQHEALKIWAETHCARQGLQISNLTTSFADGRAYGAILDAFSDCLPSSSGRAEHATGTFATLASRLQVLGCSAPFIKQLTASASAIPTRETTISTLAFLASRLLQMARRRNAAATIQRALRRRLARNTISQRVALARLARACATVVQSQQRFEQAAIVLQRSWRGALESRLSRRNEDVLAFQNLARAWFARRRKRRPLAHGRYGGRPLTGVAHW
ncbi:hypothetical protein LTR53_015176, partial [Teratosphaeriaceae sp. CCFEE 6253]